MRITGYLNIEIYFVHPYSSGERATNENMNGLIRQYFPKKRSFATITETEIEFVMERLNHLENVLDSNHQIKYSSSIHPLLHLVVESRKYHIKNFSINTKRYPYERISEVLN